MPTTKNYNLSYPGPGDAPNGAGEVEDLAEDVDTAILPIDNRLKAVEGSFPVSSKSGAVIAFEGDSVVVLTNAGGGFTIDFPGAYTTVPTVLTCSGDNSRAAAVSVIPDQVTTTGFGGVAYQPGGSVAASTHVRVNYVVFG